MEYLKDYRIEKLLLEEIEEYTLKKLKSFNIWLYQQSYLEENFQKFLNNYTFFGAKLVSNNDIIGGICLNSKPNYLKQIYIESLFVEKKYQRNGIANNLLNYALNNVNLSDECTNIYLFCAQHLKHFYEKEQFLVTETHNECKMLKMTRKM